MHVIATAGHVDHGKSTLVRALTGMEPDRWAEEQRRGMTIDLGYAWTDLPSGRTVAFVDVPGHERFLGNMLAGVGPVPAAMVVVAADEGWRRQSGEHLAALDALGVSAGLLVVTRSDLADPGPAITQARAALDASTLRGAEEVAVSGRTGQGLEQLRAALDRLVSRLPEPDLRAPVRLWVDRSFTVRGSGTVVTGTLTAGVLRVGDELQVSPGERRVRVRGLQSLGVSHQEVGAVARVAVNLRGVEREAIGRGDALVTPGAWVQTVAVDVRAEPTGDRDQPLPATLVLHVGSAAVAVRVRRLGDAPSPVARLQLDRPLPLRPGDRGLLRDPGLHSVAAGVRVLDIDPARLRRSGDARRRGAQLAAGPLDPVSEVRRRAAVSRHDLDGLGVLAGTAALPAGLVETAGLIVATVDWQDWAGRLRELAGGPGTGGDDLADGVPAMQAAGAIGLPDPVLLGPLAAEAGLVLDAGRVRRAGATLQLTGAAARTLQEWQRRWSQEPFAAPESGELAAGGLDPRRLAAAERAGLVVRLRDGIVLAADAPGLAVRRLAALPQPFSASQARSALGTTRRVAIPLLEHLDAQRRTRRVDGMLREVVGGDASSG